MSLFTFDESNRATYCPEDNKLRLYVGRVPRPEYDALRAQGWTSTPKQDCDFVAHWTPDRRDTCIAYAGIIEDEDMGPDERAADRAERFAEYRDKRSGEAYGHADRYESGPSAHGYQNQQRGERAAARHDRIGDRASDAWSKATYWQSRTAGVISHALHVSSPAVRMGRIKELEADIRKAEKNRDEYAACFERWTQCAAMTETDAQNQRALKLAYVEHGDYIHPRTGQKTYLYALGQTEDSERQPDPLNGAELCALWLSKHRPLGEEGDWLTHYRLRLAYENQMLEAQGGRAAFVEMEKGGWLGSHQIHKVNKSPATGRVVSVTLKCNGNRWGRAEGPGWHFDTFNIERLPAGAYRPPTDEERAQFAEKKKAEKQARGVVKSLLVNPTNEDAERLQKVWNDRAQEQHAKAVREHRTFGEFTPSKVRYITQANYSAASKGAHSHVETRPIHRDCQYIKYASQETLSERAKRLGSPVVELRTCPGQGDSHYSPRSVIVLTDKPQKPFPAELWTAPAPQTELAI